MRIRKLLITGVLLTAAAFGLDLTSFEDDSWKERIGNANLPIEIVEEHATHGKHSAKMLFQGSKKDTWPGFVIKFTPEELQGNNALAFTAWQETGARVSLSFRIDYFDGEPLFSNMALMHKSQSAVEYIFSSKGENGKLRPIKRFYIYMKCPRKDVTIWFDNFRIIKSKNTITPIAYIPPKGHRKPSAEENEFGAQLFARSWMEHIFRNVKPLPAEPVSPVMKAAACPGESEPVQLGIHALKNVANASITVEAPLKNSEGDTIVPEAFTVYTLAYLDKRVTYQSNKYYSQIPMVLEKRDFIAIKANESQAFWVDVAVPAEAKPGLYKGSLLVKLDGATRLVPYELQVRPFVAPEVTDMMYGEYLTAPKFVSTFADKVAQYDHDMEFMRKLNLTSVGYCVAPNTKKCTYENGKVKIEFEEEDVFVVFMELYLKYKYPCPILLLADPGDNFAKEQGFEEFTPEYKACHRAFWEAMQAECKARSWPEIIVQPEDEPAWRSLEVQSRNVQLLKYLKEIPGMRTELDGPADSYFFNEAGPHADVWNFNGCLAEPEVMERLKKEGRLATLYNNDVESYRPVTGRYVAGFFMARSGANGVFNWAMRSFSGSAFDDFDGRLGDTTNYYPGDDNHIGGPGIGMLAFREGIDDYRYIRYLQELIKQKPGPDAEYAQKVLDEILASIQYFIRTRNAAEFKSLPPTPKGDYQVTGVLNLKTGWRLEDYDRARDIIAGQIEKLLAVKTLRKEVSPVVLNLAPTEQVTYGEETPANRTIYKVMVPQIKDAPVLDGKLDDECWKNAGIMQDFSINTGGKPLAQTKAWITTDGAKLYLAVECEEEYMNHLTANVTQKNGPVFNDDCVEFFFDPTMKMTDYYQLAVNVFGTVYCGGTLGAWTPNVQVGSGRTHDRWFLELSIPLRDLKLKGNSFGFNVCRERRPLEVFELTCWSPTGQTFGTPEHFGTATMGSAWIRGIDADGVGVGNGSVKVSLMNPKADQDELTVEMNWKLTNADAVSSEGNAIQKAVPGNKSITLNFPLKLKQAGDLELLVMLKDSQGNLLEKQTIQRDVKAPISIQALSPFADEEWRAFLKLDYLQDAGEKLEIQIWAESNPKKVTKLKAGRNNRFISTIYKGGFAPLDILHARLVELKSNRILGTTDFTLFAK